MRSTYASLGASSFICTLLVASLAVVGTAAGQESVSFKVGAKLWGAGGSAAVVSFYLIDKDTGEAVWEVTADQVSLTGTKHWAKVTVPTSLKQNHLLWGVRVDARKATSAVGLYLFATTLGTKHKFGSGNLAGRAEWFVAGDQMGEVTPDKAIVPLEVAK